MRVRMGKKIRQRLITAEGRQEMAIKVYKKIQQQRSKLITSKKTVDDKHA